MTDPKDILRRFMLALCVWREARGETPKGKRLVAQVILNRATDGRWPRTIVGVVTQKLQFSSFNLGDPNCLLYPAEGDSAWEDCVRAADAVLASTEPCTPANHYHTVDIHPKWADDTKIVAREGHHIFYRL